MMQHHIAHLLAELFTSEFHRRTYHPITNHVRFFLPNNSISSHSTNYGPRLAVLDAKVEPSHAAMHMQRKRNDM